MRRYIHTHRDDNIIADRCRVECIDLADSRESGPTTAYMKPVITLSRSQFVHYLFSPSSNNRLGSEMYHSSQRSNSGYEMGTNASLNGLVYVFAVPLTRHLHLAVEVHSRSINRYESDLTRALQAPTGITHHLAAQDRNHLDHPLLCVWK